MAEEQTGEKSPMEFAATWAFILEPQAGNRTWLIERIRYRFGETDKPWIRYTLPVMGFGVFVVLRKAAGGHQGARGSRPPPRLSPLQDLPRPGRRLGPNGTCAGLDTGPRCTHLT